MAKVSQLPALGAPNGSEQVVVSVDGVTKRASIAALVAASLPVEYRTSNILGEAGGFEIDAEAPDALAVTVRDGDRNYSGLLRTWLPASVFTRPVRVTDRAGAVRWSAHNGVLASDNLASGAWTATRVTVDPVTAVAGRQMQRMTALGNLPANIMSDSILLGPSDGETQQTDSVVLRAGTGSVAAIGRGASTQLVYFDLARGLVLTQASGLTGAISRNLPDGSVLPDVTFHCSVTGPAEQHALYLAVVDADGSTAVTAGRSIFAERAQSNFGSTPTDYIARSWPGGPIPPIAVDTPYDWSRVDQSGVRQRRILIDSSSRFRLPQSLFPEIATLYLEGEIVPIAGGGHLVAPVTLRAADNSLIFVQRNEELYPGPRMSLNATKGGAVGLDLGTVAQSCIGDTIAFAVQAVPFNVGIAVNGDLVGAIYQDISPTVELDLMDPGLAPSHRLYLKSLVGFSVPETSSTMAQLGNAQRNNPAVVSSAYILRHKETYAVDKGARSRTPVIIKLGETPERATLLACCDQKWGDSIDTPGHNEMPTRLFSRLFEIARSGQIISRGPLVKWTQPPGWTTGKGYEANNMGLKITSGPRKGQLFTAFARLVTAEQNSLDGPHDLIGRYFTDNTRGGEVAFRPTFTVMTTAQMKAVYPNAIYVLPDPSGRVIEMPADSPTPGRLVMSVYIDTSTNLAIYSDAQGAEGSWRIGGLVPRLAQYGHNETNLAVLPNGWLIIINRLFDENATGGGVEPNDVRTFNVSMDGGVTWGPCRLMPNFEGAQASGGLVQTDPTGIHGPFGRLAFARPIGDILGRNGTLISHYVDADMNPTDQFYAQPPGRGNGYNGMVALWGDELYALGTETAANTGAFNGDNGVSTFLKIIDPRRGLLHNRFG